MLKPEVMVQLSQSSQLAGELQNLVSDSQGINESVALWKTALDNRLNQLTSKAKKSLQKVSKEFDACQHSVFFETLS
jgi:hypothetical protein